MIPSRRAWLLKNKERLRLYNKAYNAKRRATKEGRDRVNKQIRESWYRNRIKRLEYDKQRDRIKVNARGSVRCRVYRGTLKRKPCEVCGDVETHAHHADYSKPLDVRWLCAKHHKELHHV